MDANQALADLMEISSQVRSAALLEPSGEVEAATNGAAPLAAVAGGLLEAAGRVRADAGESVTQLEVATREGSVFVVREGDRVIAAATDPSPTVGLVFYDLKTCLRSLEREEAPAPKKPARTRAQKAVTAEPEPEPEPEPEAEADVEAEAVADVKETADETP